MIKINCSYKYLIFFFTLIALISFCEISNSAPAVTGERSNNACAATIPALGVECEAQPETQIVIFHKVAFCTAIPTEPTSTIATGLTNCTTVFENTAGAAISIQKGVGTIPEGTFTDPPFGNYTFAYVELSPVVTYNTNLVFSGTKALGSDISNNPVVAGANNCQTNGTAYFHWGNLKGISCQSGVGTALNGNAAANTSVTLNSLSNDGCDDMNNVDGVCVNGLYAGRFPGTNGNTDVYLIQSNGTLASGSALNALAADANKVAKLIIFLPMTAKITPDTTSFNLLWNNTRGMTVWQNPNGIDATKFNIGFSIAYFDMTFQIQ
jgi:hypothetical protein